MTNNALKTSPEFNKMAVRALASVLLFIITYIFLVVFASGLTLVCAYLGYLIVMAYPSWITGILGVVLVAAGITILIFVFKFVFKRTAKVKPLLIEINAIHEPELFSLIEEIITELKISRPKKVYLSPEVNAGVFYDSLFFSMFLPVKKNLQIGMGILNTHSKEELKAVLAHEFGHFSQRSMRLGSYVHNANKVLHNMLNDNENFERTLDAWGEMLSYFKLTGVLALVVIKGMKAVLKKVYEILNVNYYSLSREMEYHADAVAAAIAGSRPVIASLLRMELAETSLNIVYSYHENKVDQGLKPLNIYPQHYFVMNHFAKQQKVKIKNGLPELSIAHIWKSRGSKIVLKNQWASHPEIEHRIQRLRMFDTPHQLESKDIAVNLLVHKEELQELLTDKIFEHHFTYAKTPQLTDFEGFKSDFLSQFSTLFFDERFYGYYDDRLPYYKFNLDSLETPAELNLTYEELFNEEGLTEIKEEIVLESDINILEKIRLSHSEIQSFEYDNVSYRTQNCTELISLLKERLEHMRTQIEQRNFLIFNYFKGIVQELHQIEKWKEIYTSFQQVAEATMACQDAYLNLTAASEFMNVQTKFDQIREKMISFKEAEKVFKISLKFMLESPLYADEYSEEQVIKFEKFLSENLSYFENNAYIDDDLAQLSDVLLIFQTVYYNTCLKHKKQILTFQSNLLPETTNALSA